MTFEELKDKVENETAEEAVASIHEYLLTWYPELMAEIAKNH